MATRSLIRAHGSHACAGAVDLTILSVKAGSAASKDPRPLQGSRCVTVLVNLVHLRDRLEKFYTGLSPNECWARGDRLVRLSHADGTSTDMNGLLVDEATVMRDIINKPRPLVLTLQVPHDHPPHHPSNPTGQTTRGDNQEYVESTDEDDEPGRKICLEQEDELSPQQIAWLEVESAQLVAANVATNEDGGTCDGWSTGAWSEPAQRPM
jgi:hypothetical protein